MATASQTLAQILIPTAATTTLGIAAGATKSLNPTAATQYEFTVTPNTSFIAAPGAAIVLTGTLYDQFGNTMSGKTVTVTTSGRNNPLSSTKVTDANGEFTFTTADTSSSTTNLIDTVNFASSGASQNVTINYANTAVGTVTVTGGNTTASVTALTTTPKSISVGSSTTGAEAGAVGVTATVKDANGNALAGVPVAFTVASVTSLLVHAPPLTPSVSA